MVTEAYPFALNACCTCSRGVREINVSRPPTADSMNAASHPSEFTDIERRLAYLEMGPKDRQLLRKLAERLKSGGPAFVETFYRHLFAFEETARFLREPELVDRLKALQQKHLESMLEANWDDAYVERRHRVGDVHAQVGISPQVFLGAYNQYLQYCVRHITSPSEGLPPDYAEEVVALQKAVFFDIGLTLEAYFAQSMQSLRHALDLVYKANAELRQFAQLTSHDLKTPLATLANLCDEALDEFRGEMPAEAAKLIEAARDRAFRMSTTVDELLSSALSLHEESVQDEISAEQVIAEAIEQVRPLLERKKIELDVSAGMPRVLGDRARTREVFYNLLSNAVKFMDKAQGRIKIGYRIRDGECAFSVVDNGPGIPAEELPRVFVPFRRLPAHRDVPGSGLGLYFAKTIVEQQRGRIWAESEPGKGSSFYVVLKLADRPLES